MSKNNLKKLLSLLMVISMLFVSVPTVVVAETASSDEEYIEIYTIEDLYNVRLDLTANYILMNDIDLTEATAPGGDWDFMGNGWNPIGSNDIYGNEAFTGIFDGNGYSIIGMRIEVVKKPSDCSDMHLGLFANVQGSVLNLSLDEATITGYTNNSNYYTYAGGVAGAAFNNAYIKNCHVSGIITNITQKAGGIVGDSSGCVVENCCNSASIYGGAYVGGIVGYASGTSTNIIKCFNLASIKSDETIGSNKSYSSAYGGTYYHYNYATGICYNGKISDCYNTGRITSKTSVYYGGASSFGITKEGNNDRCYNIGNISSISSSNAHVYTYAVGGTSNNSYYLNGTGPSSTGATALTESQMKLQSMYKGFDFENVWVINPYANYPYPQLRGNVQDLAESASIVSIISIPTKTEYFTGDKLDFTGGMVKVTYVSGREEVIDITDDIISGVDMNTVGEQMVTVTVAGKSDTFAITVRERPQVEKVTVLFQPDKKVFLVGSEFDFTGAKAQITYKGGTIEYIDITSDMTTGGDINHIGKQTITFCMDGFSDSFEVEVVGITLESIALTKLPDKVTYLEGDTFSAQGLEVTATMNDGSKNVIGAGYTVSGYESTPGTHTITVEYLGKTASFEVTVTNKSIVSISLKSLPDKLEYISGQAFDDTGIQVVANYDNGDAAVIENYTICGFDDSPGIKNVTVSVDGFDVTFPVKIVSRVVTGFSIKARPSKLEYIEYEELDLTGLVAEAVYNDGSVEQVDGYTITGFSYEVGIHTVMVTYSGFYASFDVVVKARTLEDIKVTPPSKTIYMIGEEFDPSGLVVVACYDNGQHIEVKGYQLSGYDSLSSGTKAITVTYGDISRSFAIVINERTRVETDGNITVNHVVGRLGETVEVPVSVTENVGMAGFTHTIEFDVDTLKFVTAVSAEDYEDGTIIINDEKADEGIVVVLWIGATDISGDGDMYILSFEVLEFAEDGESEIKIKFEDNENVNLSGDNLIFGQVDGSVEVRSWWSGDLNGDRICTMIDLLQLAQYVSGKEMTLTEKQLLSADVNEDGIVDLHDVVLLNQWLLDAEI